MFGLKGRGYNSQAYSDPPNNLFLHPMTTFYFLQNSERNDVVLTFQIVYT